MRIQYILMPLLSMLLISHPLFAANNPDIEPIIDPNIDQEEDIMPDAMSRLMKAPDIDISNLRDPFLSSFEKTKLEEAKRYKNRKQLPENKRKREVLEFFDLSALTLVGTYQKKGHDWVASVQDSTGKAYVVKRGNYMGKRGGRIEKIDGQTIYLVEQVLNPAGEVVDSQVTLTLAEVNDNP